MKPTSSKSASAKRLAEWDKAEKARSPKNGEIVRDKFPQAFKEHLVSKDSDPN